MIEFNIQGKTIEFDETKEYYEYFRDRGVAKIKFEEMLTQLDNGELTIDEFDNYLLPMTRWITEAPRKRFYRKLHGRKLHGKPVIMGGENFFTEEGGEEIIDKLENTGKLA